MKTDVFQKGFRNNQRGFVIYLVVIVIFIIGIYLQMIITSQYMNTVYIHHKLNELQALVNAYSGLNVARAFVAGHDGRGPAWETREFKRNLENHGSFSIESVHEAGWLRVNSKGVYLKDTVYISGMLGQSVPSLSANALTIRESTADIVVADRATLTGNISTGGGKVIVRGSGVFKGGVTDLQTIRYDVTNIEDEIAEAIAIFGKIESGQNSEKQFDSTLNVRSDTVDYKGGTIRIGGDLIVRGSGCLRNTKAYVKGDVIIGDSARVVSCSIVGLGRVEMGGRANVQGNIVCLDSMEIKANAIVHYPSFLYLSGRRKNGIIIIQDNAVVRGMVSTGSNGSNGFAPRVMVKGKALLEGFLMCPDAITLYSRINGAIYTGRVVYRQDRTIYENWLRDVTVSCRDISMMVVPLLFPMQSVPRYLTVEVNNL